MAFDRYLLLTRPQQKGETLEIFPSALIGRFLSSQSTGNQTTDKQNDRIGNTERAIKGDIRTRTEKALELAISMELGAQSQIAIKANNTTDPSLVTIVGRSEPVLAISSSRYRGSNRGNSGNKYTWNQNHQAAFDNIRLHLRDITENTHYDSTRRTRVRHGALLEQEANKCWETIPMLHVF